MLIKDKDILSNDKDKTNKNDAPKKSARYTINKKNMKQAWGDAFDYYLRGITEKYLNFHGRATRLEFFGFMVAQGILFFPLYIFSEYVEMPMLVYFFYFATFIPTVAVLVRRFHDINKKAFLYLFLGLLSILSAFFISYFSLILILLWVSLVYVLAYRPSYAGIGLFGEPQVDDEVYEQDNGPILKKFIMISLICLLVISILTYVNFDNWKRQSTQKSTIDSILTTAEMMSVDKSLSDEQIKVVQKEVINMLKALDGQTVSEAKIHSNIEKIISNIVAK